MKKVAALMLMVYFGMLATGCLAQEAPNKVWTRTKNKTISRTKPHKPVRVRVVRPTPAAAPTTVVKPAPVVIPQNSGTTTVVTGPAGNKGSVVEVINPPFVHKHQIEMGIRLAPSLIFNTVDGKGLYTNFRDNGPGLRLSGGLTMDYFFIRDRAAINTGLWYTIIRSGYEIPSSFGKPVYTPGVPPQEAVYNLQYLQVPLGVKLFSSNRAFNRWNRVPNTRLYVQVNLVTNIKLAEKPLNRATNALYRQSESTRQYGFADFNVLLGAGFQHKVNSFNAVSLGLSFQRGLMSIARPEELITKTSIVSLDLGMKF